MLIQKQGQPHSGRPIGASMAGEGLVVQTGTLTGVGLLVVPMEVQGQSSQPTLVDYDPRGKNRVYNPGNPGNLLAAAPLGAMERMINESGAASAGNGKGGSLDGLVTLAVPGKPAKAPVPVSKP